MSYKTLEEQQRDLEQQQRVLEQQREQSAKLAEQAKKNAAINAEIQKNNLSTAQASIKGTDLSKLDQVLRLSLIHI